MGSAFINGTRPPYARESVGTLTSAKGLTAATYDTGVNVGSTYNHYDHVKHPEEATFQVKTGAINWTIDGTTPTTTATTDVGYLANIGDFITISGYQSIKALQCINSVASSGASIEVVYFR